MTEPPYPGSPQGPDPHAFGPPPPGGYALPPDVADPTRDPLISPDYSGWWQRGTAVVKRGLAPLVRLQLIGLIPALLLQVPIAIYSAFLSRDLNETLRTSGSASDPPEVGGLFAVLGLTVLTAFVALVVAAIVTIASIHVGVAVALGQRADLGVALRGAARRVFPLLGWQLVAGFIVVIGLCACLLPAIYLGAVFTVLPAVVAFERSGAIGRCFKLFHGDLGASTGRVATIFGLSIGVGVVGGVVGTVINTAVQAGVGGDAGLIAGSVAATLLSVALAAGVAVVTAPLTLTAYADMRARIEPLHSGILAQELGLTPPPSPPAFG